MHAGLMVSGF